MFDDTDWTNDVPFSYGGDDPEPTQEQDTGADDVLPEAERAAAPLLVDVGEIVKHPPSIRWLIDDLLPAEAFCVIFGPSGMGKSFAVLDMLASIATGHLFHDKSTTRKMAAYFCGEGFGGIGRRLAAWQEHNETKLAGRMFASASIPPLLDGGADVVIQELAALPEMPGIIGIDTVSRALGGANENASEDMAAFVAACDRIRASAPGSTLVAVHHTGWGDQNRARGSSVLRAAVDLELSISKDDAGHIWLGCTKAKDTEPPSPMAFRLEGCRIPWADDDGEPMSSAVLVHVPEAVANATTESHKRLGDSQRLCLAVLKQMHAETRANIAEAAIGTQPRVSTKDWRDRCKAEGFRGKWTRLMDTLSERGLIEEDGIYVTPNNE